MKFTNRVPADWKELQDLVAEYLIAAGYLNELSSKLSEALDVLESLSVKPNKPDRYIATVKAYMEETE